MSEFDFEEDLQERLVSLGWKVYDVRDIECVDELFLPIKMF
jgi:hypothetical protein